jgi:hypothetical protein
MYFQDEVISDPYSKPNKPILRLPNQFLWNTFKYYPIYVQVSCSSWVLWIRTRSFPAKSSRRSLPFWLSNQNLYAFLTVHLHNPCHPVWNYVQSAVKDKHTTLYTPIKKKKSWCEAKYEFYKSVKLQLAQGDIYVSSTRKDVQPITIQSPILMTPGKIIFFKEKKCNLCTLYRDPCQLQFAYFWHVKKAQYFIILQTFLSLTITSTF